METCRTDDVAQRPLDVVLSSRAITNLAVANNSDRANSMVAGMWNFQRIFSFSRGLHVVCCSFCGESTVLKLHCTLYVAIEVSVLSPKTHGLHAAGIRTSSSRGFVTVRNIGVSVPTDGHANVKIYTAMPSRCAISHFPVSVKDAMARTTFLQSLYVGQLGDTHTRHIITVAAHHCTLLFLRDVRMHSQHERMHSQRDVHSEKMRVKF